jgi:hypothetical protein
MRDKLIYLASPYSLFPGGRDLAFELVCQKAAEIMSMGYNVFCPIAHSHPIEEHGMGGEIKDGDFWLKQDFAILDKCDEIWVYMMPGWSDSYGVTRELDRAKRLKLPIEYLYFDDKEPAYFKAA